MKTRIHLFLLFTLAVCFALSLNIWAEYVSGYTVEFTYSDNQYVLGGGESVPLSEILDELGLTGEVTAVTVSDPNLFSVSDDVGEFIVSSHKPFDSEEKMTVIIGGDEYVITVTDATGNLYYIDENGEETYRPTSQWRRFEEEDDPEWADNYIFTKGWHAVTSSFTFNKRIKVTGDVQLILCDGCTLTVKGGINVPSGKSLTIYCQKGGTGKLIIPYSVDDSAGIGGNDGKECGTVNIYGGSVEITVNDRGAGIGGGERGSGGNINIYGGTVKVVSKDCSAGIGGGYEGNGGNIHIYGGMVTANGGANSAGIGGGYSGSGGEITISGGTVEAKGGDSGAGIGGGWNNTGGTIIISGGIVTATSGIHGAGIGGGNFGSGGEITISGGTVKATSGYNGAGIGGGFYGSGGKITITGGTVTAKGTYGQAIGHGSSASDSGELILGDKTKEKYLRAGIVTVVGGIENVEWAEQSKRDSTCRRDGMVTVRVQRCAPHILGKNGCCVYCGASASGSFVPYADASGAVQPSVDCEHITASHTSLNSSGLTGGWYAVKSDVTVSSRIKVKGSVNLILCDGATLTASEGITVPNGNSLTIWGQSGVYNVPTMTTVNTFGTGKLYTQTPDSGDYRQAAALGGENGGDSGVIVINGGVVTAEGKWGAGIGRGNVAQPIHKTAGSVTINGGCVTASGSSGSAGIGSGAYADSCPVTITGGFVSAVGNVYDGNGYATPGIGTGRPRTGNSDPLKTGKITITGGTVIAVAGSSQSVTHSAQAIGVNSDDAGNNGTDYLVLGNVAAYDSFFASSPVEVWRRGDTCRGVFVRLTDLCPHKYENDKCVYCGAGIICGDVNLDGKVTPLDAMILARYLAGWNGYTVNTYAADVDKDNDVTVKDAIILARHIAGWDGYVTLPYKEN